MDRRKPDSFPTSFNQLLDHVALKEKNLVVPCQTTAEALELRRQFYLFRSALRREDSELASIAGLIVVRMSGSTVHFENRDKTGPAKYLADAFRREAQNGAES